MKSHIKAFFGHIVVKVVTFSVITVAVVAGSYVYADHNGLLPGSNHTPSITWLSRDNVADELGITQSSTGAIAAKPGTPVVLVECPTQTCDSSTLNIPAVIKQFGDKVKILAINPYTQKDLAAALEQSFIMPSVQNVVVETLAQSVAQQKAGGGKTVTAAEIQAVMQDKTFQSQAQQVLASPAAFEQLAPSLYALLQPIYPKFFVFDASFNLMSAATGIDITNQSELTSLITSSLTPASNAPASPSDSATTGGTSSSSGEIQSSSSTTPSASSNQSSSPASAPSKSDTSSASGSGK